MEVLERMGILRDKKLNKGALLDWIESLKRVEGNDEIAQRAREIGSLLEKLWRDEGSLEEVEKKILEHPIGKAFKLGLYSVVTINNRIYVQAHQSVRTRYYQLVQELMRTREKELSGEYWRQTDKRQRRQARTKIKNTIQALPELKQTVYGWVNAMHREDPDYPLGRPVDYLVEIIRRVEEEGRRKKK